MRAINLLPRETNSPKLGFEHTILVGMAFTLVVAVAVAGGFYIEKAQAATERQRLAVAQAALSQAQSQKPSANAPVLLQVPAVLSQEQPWHVALHTALTSRVAWDVLLRQLEYVVPDKISLTSVTLGGAGATPGAAGGTITLGGSAFSSADIATFLSTLARVPKLSQVTLLTSSTSKGKGKGTRSVTTFQITAQMTVPAPPAPPAAPGTDTSTTTGAEG
jgi:Tfp pilus assembly protein PilN